MGFENTADQKSEAIPSAAYDLLDPKASNDNGIFREYHGLTTAQKEDLIFKKIDADKTPLDKVGQELRRQIDKDIIEGNYEDIAKLMSTTPQDQLLPVLKKVCSDFAGESEIRQYPSVINEKSGEPVLRIRIGTPPWACYFGERAIDVSAKGVEFVDVQPFNPIPRYPEPGSTKPTLRLDASEK